MTAPANPDAAVARRPPQSLYRRFRPQRFAEVRGQDHVTGALRNAARDQQPNHAYLFSGPRGTGKTSTARILAKALNCEAPVEGEPCGTCPSCLAIQAGTSLDVHELDAASNNGVEAMRDLVARAALGTPGRWKVYIVDEVHMLSTTASNALLKTLEEPPGHVVFVLATTDAQKMLPTIRSRAQHYQFRLLDAETVRGLLADVNSAADLQLDPDVLDFVTRRGEGSARDALSALDQAAAGGGVASDRRAMDALDDLVEALCERDGGRGLRAVAEACSGGREPRGIATEVLEHLREAFLVTTAPDLVGRPASGHVELAGQAARLGTAGLVRAMETLGQALVDMRDALEPRITLEVAVVRVAQADLDVSRGAVLERLERLERRLAADPMPLGDPTPAAPASAAATPGPGPAGARAALGALRPRTTTTRPAAPETAPAAPEPPQKAPARATDPATVPMPTREELTKAWGDRVLGALPGRAKARFGSGRFRAVEDGKAVFAVPNDHFLPRCREVQGEVEARLAEHFGRPVPLLLVVDEQAGLTPEATTAGPDDDGTEEVWTARAESTEAPAVASPEQRLMQAFPGAEEVEE